MRERDRQRDGGESCDVAPAGSNSSLSKRLLQSHPPQACEPGRVRQAIGEKMRVGNLSPLVCVRVCARARERGGGASRSPVRLRGRWEPTIWTPIPSILEGGAGRERAPGRRWALATNPVAPGTSAAASARGGGCSGPKGQRRRWAAEDAPEQSMHETETTTRQQARCYNRGCGASPC